MVPAKVVSLSDHRTTLPPLPRPVADALMVVAASTLTVVAVGITKLSSLALGLATRLCVRVAAAPVAADQHLAAAGAARRIDACALASLMSSPVTRIVPPCVPFFLPAAASVPEILTVWVGRARRLAAAGGGVEHDHAVVAADRVGPDHALGVDDGIDHRARRRGGELDPPAVGAERAALGVADQRLERPAGGDVDDLEAMLSPTASVISLSPYMSSVKLLPDASATVPSVAVMVPELRTPGATSAAKPPLVAVILP